MSRSKDSKCQIFCVPEIADSMGTPEILSQRGNRIKRILKRRLNYLLNLLKERINNTGIVLQKKSNIKSVKLQPGDTVRVKSKEKIQATLDRWNQLKGCSFMEEMQPYCGTTQRVLKRIETFLDERDYLTKKCKGIVILDGVFCEGTKDFGTCDRTCFFFWRDQWLEKID